MKKKLSVLAVLVLAVAISAYSVGGTYAKYTSAFTGATSTARVAKWAFSLDEDGNSALANSFTFNLFNTILDTDGSSAETDVDVDGTGSEHVIAPGTSGTFSLKFYNQSEVNANYTISLSVTNAGVPLEFKVGAGDWTSDLTSISASGAINMGAYAEIPVQWRWVYENTTTGTGDTAAEKLAYNDGVDTGLGEAGTAAPTATATITVTQVD